MWSLIKPKVRHLIALLLFIPLFLILLYKITVVSDEYQTAVHFVNQDPQLTESIGKVDLATFDFWHGFQSNGSSAEFPFKATTGKGTFSLSVRLKNKSEKWSVTTVEITNSQGRSFEVEVK